MEILKVHNVTHQYQDGMNTKKALDNVSLDFNAGKLYAIVGASGSGKTTLLSLISGLDTVQDGTILYKGKSIENIGYTKYRAQYVNVVFQAYNLINYLTARENLLIAMDIKKVTYKNKKEKAGEILMSLGFTEDMLDRPVLKLSGGEQQRVAVARALVHDSEIILADEPTGNLDDNTENDLMLIFKDLVKLGKCVVVVTHSNEVAKNADIVYKISNGKVS